MKRKVPHTYLDLKQVKFVSPPPQNVMLNVSEDTGHISAVTFQFQQ